MPRVHQRVETVAVRRALVFVVGLLLLFAVAPVAAGAKDGRPEVRVGGVCGGGATSKLRLRSDGDSIEVQFEVDHSRAGEVWRVVLVHERRVGWKGSVKTSRPGGSFEVERTLKDFQGADEVSVRAGGPRGIVCRADATLRDA
jgi:hypothetical protein